MYRQLWSMVAVAALFCTTPSLFAQAGDNPYRKANVGDWVSYEMKINVGGQSITSTMKQTVKAKTDKEATVEVEATAPGQNFKQEQKIPLDKPFDPTEMAKQQGGPNADVEKISEGKDSVTVGGKKYDCKWVKLKVKVKQFNIESTSTVWFSSDVPLSGLVKMEAEVMGQKYVMELTGSGKGK
jgi:hypothetical protein